MRALQEQMADATRTWADERRALVRDQQAKTNELQREAAVRQETLIQALEVADGQAEAARRELWLANQQAHVSTSLVSCRVCVSVSSSPKCPSLFHVCSIAPEHGQVPSRTGTSCASVDGSLVARRRHVMNAS